MVSLLPVEVARRARRIALVLTDCDGVLTDAGVYYSPRGAAMKRFSFRDGMGVERLRNEGIDVGIVTGERSRIVVQRARKMGVNEVHLGARSKLTVAREIAERRGISLDEMAFIGDDVNDAELLRAVALSACPVDAEPEVQSLVDMVCSRPGGQGAFREFADRILSARRATPPAPFIPKPPRETLMQLVTSVPERLVSAGGRWIGDAQAIYVIGEIGINHNGSMEMAKKLIDGAVAAGCDCVKLQKRTPELCVPPDQRLLERETPWGRITYIEYRRKVEFNFAQYAEIDRYCRDRGIAWTASCWDEPSVDFIARFNPPFIKIPSACLVDHDLLRKARSAGVPLMVSTGMSEPDEIEQAVAVAGTKDLLIAHSTSTYPCPPGELNLRVIQTLRDRFPGVPIGYSGHETGLATTYAAVALGASFVERHITIDRSMWGSDQAASVEIGGLMRLARDIRDIEAALGDGVKRVYDSELGALKRLRRVTPEPVPVALDA